MSSWVISAGTGVTLPFGPTSTRITNPAKFESFTQEGNLPIVIVDGAEVFTLELRGVLFDCWESVIEPLLAKRGFEVALTTPDGDLDDTYVLASFEVERVGALPKWSYTMCLVKGSSHVIL